MQIASAMHASQSAYFSFNSFGTPAGSNLGEHYQILQIQSSAPDNGRKHRTKRVELTRNNKLIYIVHLVGYLHNCITTHGFTNVKKISYYHSKAGIIQRGAFVSGETSKMYLLWSIYPQPWVHQVFTVTCICNF